MAWLLNQLVSDGVWEGLYIILNLSFNEYMITPNVCLCDKSVMLIINPGAVLGVALGLLNSLEQHNIY